MINLIIGKKGSGKTSKMVDDLNERAVDNAQNVICIEYGRRLDRNVKYQIRLVDISEYPVKGYDNLLSFISGICAKDYDITHLYIDSIFKVAQSESFEELSDFIVKLDEFLKSHKINVHISLSADQSDLTPATIERVQLIEE